MEPVNDQLKHSLSLFANLKARRDLPPKLQQKLEFLAACLQDQQINASAFPDLDEDQKNALRIVDAQVQAQLFQSIVKCLTGESCDNLGCWIRKSRMFSSFEQCFIGFDSEQFVITRKVKEIYAMSGTKVSSEVKKKGDKFTFRIEFKLATKGSVTYMLGFNKQETANEVYNKLRNIAKQLRELQKRRGDKPNQRKGEFLQESGIIPEQSPRFSENYEQTAVQNHRSIVTSVQQKQLQPHSELPPPTQLQVLVQPESLQYLDEIESDSGFKIVYSSDSSRILQHQFQQSRMKMFMTLPSSLKPETLFEMITHSGQWNINIHSSSVLGMLQANKYVVYERYKQHSYNYRARDFVFMRTAFIRNSPNPRYYLIDESVEHRDAPTPSRMVVRGTVHNRTILLIPQIKDKPNAADAQRYLLIISTKMSFGGYNSQGNDKTLAIEYLKAFSYFLTYCHQTQFSEAKRPNLYNFQLKQQVIPMKKKPVPMMSSSQTIATIPQIKPIKNHNHRGKQLFSVSPTFLSQPLSNDFISLVLDEQAHLGLIGLGLTTAITPSLCCTKPPHDFVFQNGDWVLNKEKQFIFTNRQVMDAQKDVIKYIIRKIGSNLMSGKSVMNMSLPVDIFEGRSLLERSAQSFGYAPILLSKAAETTDVVQQIRILSVFLCASTMLQLKAQKPFNPIIGETFQGFLGQVPICYQQISHHPPVSAYYAKAKNYTLWGNLVSYAELGLNSGTGGNLGPLKVQFDSNQEIIECYFPPCQISGLLLGDRKFRMVDKFYVFNRKNLLFAEISLGKEKKDIYSWVAPKDGSRQKMTTSDLCGGIFKVTQEFMNRFVSLKTRQSFGGLAKKDVVSKLSTIEGAWNDSIYWDGKLYKSVYQPEPYLLQYQKAPLPSNSNFRQDIIWKKVGNLAMAQKSKEKLENQQREDKKLRLKKKIQK